MKARLRGGGPAGNERLTAMTAAVLLVLLVAEGTTLLSLGSLLSVHVFVGMLLIAPVALKLASTGWRFLRYYAGSAAYRRQGPPRLPLRILAPALVGATVALLGTGVALLLTGRGSGGLLLAHKASFIVWLGLAAVHVLAYLPRIPRLAGADWHERRPAARALPGARARSALLLGVLLAGLGLALLALPLAAPWLDR